MHGRRFHGDARAGVAPPVARGLDILIPRSSQPVWAVASVSLVDVISFLTNASVYAYLAIFVIGLGCIVLGMLLGGLHSMVDFGHDLIHGDVGNSDSEIGLSPLSPLMLAVFGMVFGVTGLGLTAYTHLGTFWILLITSAVALGLDYAFYTGVYNYFITAQASSIPHAQDAVGTWATVATRIGPGMTGTINYEAAGRRTVGGAHAEGGATYEPGTIVHIVAVRGGVATVSTSAPGTASAAAAPSTNPSRSQASPSSAPPNPPQTNQSPAPSPSAPILKET